jgi:hypothetical protein
MSFTNKPLVDAAQVATGPATLYTTPASTRTIIDKCTVTNTTVGAATITIYLVKSAGAAGASTTIISAKSVAAGDCYTCPEVVGHDLNGGDFLAAASGTNNALTIRVSGREIN